MGCKVIDPYTGQIMQEMPDIRKRGAYTSVTANGKFIAVKKSTKNDNGTLTLTIRNIFTNKKEVFRLNGELKSRNAKFACHSFGDELIAVNGCDRKLKIYRRVEKNNGNYKSIFKYSSVMSIKMTLSLRNCLRRGQI